MISASLGAHYSNQFIKTSIGLFWHSLFGSWVADNSRTNLRKKLEDQFGGTASLVYKGRDAIEVVLRAYELTQPTDVVLTQAFTCLAIEEGILRAGATPSYVDVGDGQLNLTVKTLERAYQQHGTTVKAVIVQHSLGHPAEIEAIARWCSKHSILLIEDLAQSYGARQEGALLGTFGDAVILSFGRDKVIDAVSGGAAVFRTQPVNAPINFPLPPKPAVLKDLAYPFFTGLIRGSYDLIIGKLIHKTLTLLGLMGNPTQSPTKTITALPESLARLTLVQLTRHDQIRSHRQTIAALYLEGLADTPLQLYTQKSHLTNGSLLRVTGSTNQPTALLAALKAHHIHLTDRWYRSPVDGGQLKFKTRYQNGSCPNAEKLTETIINLPTHPKITIKDAVKIIGLVQQYLEK